MAMRAFVEVGRQGSIKEAARVLAVTAGAVSQQVKLLEERLGVQLLERLNRQVRLTVDGARLFGHAAPGFDRIEEAAQLFAGRARQSQTLTVSTTPSFAATWLASRLGRFQNLHPGIDVRVETSIGLADLAGGVADVAIRHGGGHYPGLDVVRLFEPRLVAVGSPALLRAGPAIRSPRDCLRYKLLLDRDHADWAIWLKAHGIPVTRKASAGPSYADDALLIRAAISGQGLAIVRDVYADDDLAQGRIALAFDAPVSTGLGYFAVCRPDRLVNPKIAAFRAWIAAEAALPTQRPRVAGLVAI
jgi:LysR family glycine cleavage system transcriptional activator